MSRKDKASWRVAESTKRIQQYGQSSAKPLKKSGVFAVVVVAKMQAGTVLKRDCQGVTVGRTKNYLSLMSTQYVAFEPDVGY